MWLWAFLLSPLIFYALILAFVFFAQTSLLFPSRSVPLAAPMPDRWQRLTIESQTGHSLHGVHVPAVDRGAEPLLILGFGGNAWNAESAAAFLHEQFPEADVVTFHYRGYAPSGGSPSASALQEDALAIHDWVRQRLSERRILAVGFSIGSGVASHLASRRPIDGLILVTPFDSLADVARDHYPWLPVRWLFRHQMEPAQDLRATSVPVAIIAAGEDRLIRPERTRALARVVPRLVFDRTIAGASHNDIYERSAFRIALDEAVGRLRVAD